MQLRPYQDKIVSDLRVAMTEHRRVLLESFVGSGKTQVFSYIARGVTDKQRRVLITAHRRELIGQISRALTSWGVEHGEVGKYVPSHRVLIGNAFTIVNRLNLIADPDLIIVDEAHHVVEGGNTWGKITRHWTGSRILGVTATPQRLDGKGLGASFDVMVHGPTPRQLIDLGFISQPEVYAPAMPRLEGVHTRHGDYVASELEAAMTPRITGSAVAHYQKLSPGTRALAFCVSVKHAETVAEQFNAAGIPAASVDGNMWDKLRDDIFARLVTGELKVVTSCDLISEGLDVPAVETVILLRPTKSVGLYIQQVGRGLRVAEGKTRTVVLDHAGNTAMHGFVDDEREWTLEGRAAGKRGDVKPPSVRTCPKCFAAHRPSLTCPKCGFEYPVASREVEQVEGELVKVSAADIVKAELLQDPKRAKQYEYLKTVARKKGYHDGWAWHIVAAQEAKNRMKKAAKRDA